MRRISAKIVIVHSRAAMAGTSSSTGLPRYFSVREPASQMDKAVFVSMGLVCLLSLLIPRILQAQLPVWIDFGGGGLTHGSSESSLTYWSFNTTVVHGPLLHQVACRSGEEFLHGLSNLHCIGPCPPTEPKRLSSVSYRWVRTIRNSVIRSQLSSGAMEAPLSFSESTLPLIGLFHNPR